MKRLICSLAAVVSLALSSRTPAAAEDENVVTGTVVQAYEGYIEIDEGKHDGRSTFGVFTYGIAYKPRVGERVRVHIRPGGGRVYADKIEKLGTGGSSKKR
jgi:hypothetical protein